MLSAAFLTFFVGAIVMTELIDRDLSREKQGVHGIKYLFGSKNEGCGRFWFSEDVARLHD